MIDLSNDREAFTAPLPLYADRREQGPSLLGLLAGADQRDGTRPELRRIGTRHDCQPSVQGCQLPTRTGT
jgi:hypothetical protein